VAGGREARQCLCGVPNEPLRHWRWVESEGHATQQT
jgi:hypothetical protein